MADEEVTLGVLGEKLDGVEREMAGVREQLTVMNGNVARNTTKIAVLESRVPAPPARIVTSDDCDKVRARKLDRWVALLGPVAAVLLTYILMTRGG